MPNFITDDSGNRCEVEFFGSIEAAQEALDSLVNCTNCANCSDCSDCINCSDCIGCLDCIGCRGCGYCIGCSHRRDYRGNLNVVIPKIKNIHQKVYDAAAKDDALDMRKWHTCGTTHCRAGWVVTLAGEDGEVLEKKFGTRLAAQLIYSDSSPLKVSVNRFFDKDVDALRDMKKMAEEEKSSQPKLNNIKD